MNLRTRINDEFLSDGQSALSAEKFKDFISYLCAEENLKQINNKQSENEENLWWGDCVIQGFDSESSLMSVDYITIN